MLVVDNKCAVCMSPIDIANAKSNGYTVRCKACNAINIIARSDEARKRLESALMDMEKRKFDDAETLYRKVLEYDAKEPEAYWGIALAKYGVVYVVDKNYDKDKIGEARRPLLYKLPKTLFTDDDDYKKALSLATEEQKEQYKSEAEYISATQQQFAEYEKEGLRYDTFICCKVSEIDENGKKIPDTYTRDNTLAHKCHKFLQSKGLHPFYSELDIDRVSEAGARYEAKIRYALCKASSMLVVCTNERYLKTPWVENEIARYVALMEAEVKPKDSITFVCESKRIFERIPGTKHDVEAIILDDVSVGDTLKNFVKRHMPESEYYYDGDVAGMSREKKFIFDHRREFNKKHHINNDTDRVIKAVEALLDGANWGGADSMLDDMLKEHPNNPFVIWLKILCINEVKDNEQLVQKLARSISAETSELFDRAVQPSPEMAQVYFEVFGDASLCALRQGEFACAQQLFKAIALKDKFHKSFTHYRDTFIDAVCNTSSIECLNQSAKWLGKDVMAKAHAYAKFAKHNIEHGKFEVADKALGTALKCDPRNTEILWLKIFSQLKARGENVFGGVVHNFSSAEEDLFKDIYQYSDNEECKDNNVRKLVNATVWNIQNKCDVDKAFEVFKWAIRYVDDDNEEDNNFFFTSSCKVGTALLDAEHFSHARGVFANLVNTNPNCYQGYLGVLQANLKCRSIDDFVMYPTLISKYKEFVSILAHGDEAIRKKISGILAKQEAEIKHGAVTQARKQQEREAEQKRKAEIKAKARARRAQMVESWLSSKLVQIIKKMPLILSIVLIIAIFVVVDVLLVPLFPAFMMGIVFAQIFGLGAFFLVLRLCGYDTWQRWVAPVVAVVVVITAYYPVVYFADSDIGWFNLGYRPQESKNFIFQRSEDGVILTKYVGGKTSSITVPDKVGKRKVVAVKKGILQGTKPRSLSVGSMSFLGHYWGASGPTESNLVPKSLTQVTVRDGVIPSYAFYNCEYVTDIKCGGEGVVMLGYNALENSGWLNAQADGVVYFDEFLYSVKGTLPANTNYEIVDGTKHISSNAFSGQTNLVGITFPTDCVASIGDGAFERTGLVNVTLPNSLTQVSSSAFAFCTNLTTVTLPNGVEKIGGGAFINCSKLASIDISSVKYIEANAFSNCVLLTNANLQNAVSIDARAFALCNVLSSVSLSNKVIYMGASVFADCVALGTITIPNGTDMSNWHIDWFKRYTGGIQYL